MFRTCFTLQRALQTVSGSVPDEFLRALELATLRDLGIGCPWGSECGALLNLIQCFVGTQRVICGRAWLERMARALDFAVERANTMHFSDDARRTHFFAKKVRVCTLS